MEQLVLGVSIRSYDRSIETLPDELVAATKQKLERSALASLIAALVIYVRHDES